jgi:hypothetical protein
VGADSRKGRGLAKLRDSAFDPPSVSLGIVVGDRLISGKGIVCWQCLEPQLCRYCTARIFLPQFLNLLNGHSVYLKL